MTSLEIILIITSVLLGAFSVYSARVLYRLGLTVLRVEDALEESLEIMDDRIDSMQKILEVPLFSDSPEIKKIHNDMQACRNALIGIAASLATDITELETE